MLQSALALAVALNTAVSIVGAPPQPVSLAALPTYTPTALRCTQNSSRDAIMRVVGAQDALLDASDDEEGIERITDEWVWVALTNPAAMSWLGCCNDNAGWMEEDPPMPPAVDDDGQFVEAQADLIMLVIAIHNAMIYTGDVDRATINQFTEYWVQMATEQPVSIGWLIASFEGMLNAFGSFEAGWITPWELTGAMLKGDPVHFWDLASLGDWRYRQAQCYEDGSCMSQ